MTVLSVEGDPDDRDLIRRGLSRCDHVRLLSFEDSDALFAHLEASPSEEIGLFLLDLAMAKEGAIEILGQLRRSTAYACTPVIVFSGSEDSAKVRRCYEAGANAYVRKPVDYVEFIECLDQICGFWIGQALLPAVAPTGKAGLA